jgi:flagellar basal-body rod protein FlgB
MTDPILFGPSLDIYSRALDGLSKRRDVISQNVANVDTPGYKAQKLTFEDALQRVIKNNGSFTMKTTNQNHLSSSGMGPTALNEIGPRSGGAMRADQNNVDIDMELTELTETGLRYQAISNAVGRKFTLIKTIAR